MSDVHEILDLIKKQDGVFDGLVRKNDTRLSQLERQIDEVAKKVNRPNISGGPVGFDAHAAPTAHDVWIDAKTGERIAVLGGNEKLAQPGGAPSLGRLLRGIALGGHAPDARELAEERKSMYLGSDSSGGYVVGGAVASEWIDALRSAMVLTRAGAVTIPMDTSELRIARIVDDPVCGWHGEGHTLTQGNPTFGAVNLTAKTIYCLCRLSLELAQDAPNIEAQLSRALTNSMAAAIDAAGLVGVNPATLGPTGTTHVGAAAGPAGIMNLSGRSSVTSVGSPTNYDYLVDAVYALLVANVPPEKIGAFIAHPAVWRKMARLKSGISGDQTPLTMPAEIASMPKYWTTAMPLVGGTTAAGMVANWSDLLLGIRKQIEVRVLTTSLLASALELEVLAYARVDWAAARPASFCSVEGITV